MRERKRTNDPEAMRNRILDVAAASFQERGYAATSMHDLFRAAGVTGGALYHHFPSKKAIALAVIGERVAAEIGSTWVDRIVKASSAATGIVAVFDDVIAQLGRAGRVSGCPLGNLALELSLADADFRGALAHEYTVWREAVARKIEADPDAAYAAGDAEGFATFVIALFSGAIGLAKTEQDVAPLRACRERLAAIMS